MQVLVAQHQQLASHSSAPQLPPELLELGLASLLDLSVSATSARGGGHTRSALLAMAGGQPMHRSSSPKGAGLPRSKLLVEITLPALKLLRNPPDEVRRVCVGSLSGCVFCTQAVMGISLVEGTARAAPLGQPSGDHRTTAQGLQSQAGPCLTLPRSA